MQLVVEESLLKVWVDAGEVVMWTRMYIWGSECGFCCYCFALFEDVNMLPPTALTWALVLLCYLHCLLFTCTITLPRSPCRHFPQGVHVDFLVSPELQRPRVDDREPSLVAPARRFWSCFSRNPTVDDEPVGGYEASPGWESECWEMAPSVWKVP